jgi:hypothetical protein
MVADRGQVVPGFLWQVLLAAALADLGLEAR